MLVTFEIERTGELSPVMVAHQVGNQIGLPFEVVSMGNDDEVVQLTVEVEAEDICDGGIDSPFNQNYERVHMKVKASFGTTDSYSVSYPRRDVNDIIKHINSQGFNCYLGGEVDSTMAVIKTCKAGFVFHDCIKLQFANETECRNFEALIRPQFSEENFYPRRGY